MTNIGYAWDPISDLPEKWPELHRKELEVIHQQWLQEREILQDPQKLHRLEERLATAWAIETGIIERLYTIDRGVTESMIDLGLQALDTFHQRRVISQNAVQLIHDQRAALEFVFEFVRQERELSISYIKELHQSLTLNQISTEAINQFGNKMSVELRKGEWKILDNNPTRQDGLMHQYCPPIFVQDEMEQLLRWHHEHIQKGVPEDIEAAWLHHRFTQIHPFQDGNGRVARALATLIFLRGGYLPLVVRDAEHREAYLDALEKADHGVLDDLVALFAKIQQNDLSSAIDLVRTLRGTGVVRIAKSAAERAKLRMQQSEQEIRELSDRLMAIATTRLQEIRSELIHQFVSQSVNLDAWVGQSNPAIETWWSTQLVETARQHGYWANLTRFRRWVQLRLRLPDMVNTQTNIIISFHHRSTIAGLMVADAFMSTTRSSESAGATSTEDWEDWRSQPLVTEPFFYSLGHNDVENQFRVWLDNVMDAALDRWQSRI